MIRVWPLLTAGVAVFFRAPGECESQIRTFVGATTNLQIHLGKDFGRWFPVPGNV